MATIRITNLKLRATIGTNDWERDIEQDVTINIALEYDAAKAMKSDNLKYALDYKKLTKKIINHVESSSYFLIEKLASAILEIILEIPNVQKATVRVDKPMALRFADSVSIEISGHR